MRAPLLRVPAHKHFDAQGNALALAGKAHSGAMPPLQRFAERVPCELQDAHASAGSLVLDIFVERGVPVRLSGCLSKSQLQPYLRPLGISGECLRIPRFFEAKRGQLCLPTVGFISWWLLESCYLGYAQTAHTKQSDSFQTMTLLPKEFAKVPRWDFSASHLADRVGLIQTHGHLPPVLGGMTRGSPEHILSMRCFLLGTQNMLDSLLRIAYPQDA